MIFIGVGLKRLCWLEEQKFSLNERCVKLFFSPLDHLVRSLISVDIFRLYKFAIIFLS